MSRSWGKKSVCNREAAKESTCICLLFLIMLEPQKGFSYQILSSLHQFQNPHTVSPTSSSIIHFSAKAEKTLEDENTFAWHWEKMNNTLNKQLFGDCISSRRVNDCCHAAPRLIERWMDRVAWSPPVYFKGDKTLTTLRWCFCFFHLSS